jgi:hypothetical protein
MTAQLANPPQPVGPKPAPTPPLRLTNASVAWPNVCLLRLLERIALTCADAGIPLMVLKGAALHLTLHRNPGDRPMSDLDLMVPPKHAPRMLELLERLGGRLGRPLVRDDFFPRYHYERDVNWPGVTPLRVDLHAHPFRPLAYIRSVPPHAFWRGAERVRVGRAPVCVPNAEDMLLHLAVHCAVHGNQRRQWLTDLRQWVGWHRQRFDWSRFERTARDWGLHHAADVALDAAERALGPIRPPVVRARMGAVPVTRRARRIVRQAPRDATGALGHVLTNAACATGWRFRAGYLRAMLWPDRAHMAEWYDHRHAGWLAVGRCVRLVSPLLRRVPGLWQRIAGLELREVGAGFGVFATRPFAAGSRVLPGVKSGHGAVERAGKTACVRHSCQPNVRVSAQGVVALRLIAAGEELRLDHGRNACDCRRFEEEAAVADVPAAGRDDVFSRDARAPARRLAAV